MTIQQHASFDSSAAELNATSKLVKAWESKNAKNAAKAGGISLMALSLAACGGSSTTTSTTAITQADLDAQIAAAEAAAAAQAVAEAAQAAAEAAQAAAEAETAALSTPVSLTLTTSADALVGNAGNDTFTGASGTLATADVIADGSVTDADVLNATVTANNLAPTVTNIETVNINGQFAVTGLDMASVKNATTTTVDGAIINTVATVTNVDTSATGTIAAGTNVRTFNVTADATNGTGGQLVIDAGLATTVALTAAHSADSAKLVLNGQTATVTGTNAIETLVIDSLTDGASITMDNGVGTSLEVAGAGSVTLTSNSWTGETVTDTGAGALTIVSDATGAVDVSKIDASVIKQTAAINNNTFSVKNGANVEFTADLGNAASTISAPAATATTNAITTEFSTVASQTGVVFANVKTANIIADAPAITGTDLTFAVLNNGTNDIVMTGTNDVVVTLGTAKTFDASALVGKLTYTQATGAAETIKGGSDTATVTFKGVALAQTFNGTDAASAVTFATTTGTATATGGSGNDVITASAAIAGTGTLDAQLGDGTNSVTANSATTGTINVVTGSGADTVSATAFSTGTLQANTGGGVDSVTVGAALTSGVISASLGAGADTFTIGASTATGTIVIDGGADSDTLSLAATADLSGANLNLSNVEVIKITGNGTVTFDEDDISGQSFTVKGTAGANDILAVTTASSAAQVIDLSGLTMDQSLSAAISKTSITGGAAADVITGTAVNDTINGGGGADTIVLASTATLNGVDVLTFVEGTDKLDVSAFLGGGTVAQNGGVGTAVTAYSSAATADAAIAGKVVVLADATDGTAVTAVDTASEIAALIDGAGDVFSITAGGSAVVIAGSAAATGTGYVYYVKDANSDGDVGDAGEVVNVATIAGFDTDLLTSDTLIA